jgi:hypothetical protein
MGGAAADRWTRFNLGDDTADELSFDDSPIDIG